MYPGARLRVKEATSQERIAATSIQTPASLIFRACLKPGMLIRDTIRRWPLGCYPYRGTDLLEELQHKRIYQRLVRLFGDLQPIIPATNLLSHEGMLDPSARGVKGFQ